MGSFMGSDLLLLPHPSPPRPQVWKPKIPDLPRACDLPPSMPRRDPFLHVSSSTCPTGPHQWPGATLLPGGTEGGPPAVSPVLDL